MAISSSSVTVTTSATLLFQADADGTEVVLFNNDHGVGGHTTYVGPSDVTAATGLPVEAGASLSFRLRPNEAVYGIASTGSHEIRVMAL